MEKFGKCKMLLAQILIMAWVILSAGCAVQKNGEPISTTGFAFNTTYTISLYEGGGKEQINHCVEQCRQYEQIFSRTDENSELYRINAISAAYENLFRKKKNYKKKELSWNKKTDYSVGENGELRIKVSGEFAEIVQKALYYAKQSQGAFDITIGAYTQLWNFTDEKRIPDETEIAKKKEFVDYRLIEMEKNCLIIKKPGVILDFGGIAKGFIADKLKEYLVSQGVTSAIINLGGNVLCIGKKEKQENFCIGIQKPFADRNETKGSVSVADMSVVSSGVYERYIQTEDGKRYHHILNPKTGYPFETDLFGVTILSEKSADGDGLSTICLSLGKEKAMEYVNSLEGVYAILITDKEEVYYSEGAEKMYSY